jgi:hypothetical protein
LTEDIDRDYFGDRGGEDQIGLLEGVRAGFGRPYVGEPDRIAVEFAADEAVLAADNPVHGPERAQCRYLGRAAER